MGQLECPKCESKDLECVDVNYPKAYECRKCSCRFVLGKQALVDE
jgi:hypothetical protein